MFLYSSSSPTILVLLQLTTESIVKGFLLLFTDQTLLSGLIQLQLGIVEYYEHPHHQYQDTDIDKEPAASGPGKSGPAHFAFLQVQFPVETIGNH